MCVVLLNGAPFGYSRVAIPYREGEDPPKRGIVCFIGVLVFLPVGKHALGAGKGLFSQKRNLFYEKM
ncbi:hypothetical protein AS034_15340 [[Bacillus] enclensis]|nr:hypothetical protein AS034_15340 [[Bacillus] enclensis]